ncbi:amidohydrolase family protein, partial [candidate division WOR-3 bacterium]|nr:amidohydrolase family protein [candidate division WOR-3 bacterium]MBD3365374.1 amidohydrolase family protein [candidate division WOR-3 bacterium]
MLFTDALIHSPPDKSARADILIEGERIVKLGKIITPEGIRTYKNKIVLPGYIDSHIHLLEYGLSLLFLDLREATSAQEVLGKISSFAAETADRGFV